MDGKVLQGNTLKQSPVNKQYITFDGTEISKSNVLLYSEKGKNFTFNDKNSKRLKLKGNFDPTENCGKGKILAFKYYNSKMNVNEIPLGDEKALNDPALIDCYNKEVRKIKKGQTVSWIVAGVSFSIGLGAFIAAVSAASAL